MVIDETHLKKIIDTRFVKKLSGIYINKEINRNELLKQVIDLLTKNEYMPSNPEFVVDVNKGKGVMRYIPVFTALDYAVYFYCVLSIDEYLATSRVEGTFGGYSMGGAMRKAESVESNSPEPPSPNSNTFNPYAYIQHYGEYNAEIKKRLSDKDEYDIVELDIANFYDHIRLDLLENSVRQATDSVREPQINLLFHFLKNWNKLINSYWPQSVGLPQELIGDCSRILANFYLQEYDKLIKEFCDVHNIRYLRYADDQIFFIPKKFDNRKVVQKASVTLSRFGLNVNPKKVVVWHDKDEFRKYKAFDLFETLPPEVVYPKDHTKATANAFAERFLSTDRSEIIKSGAPILKTIISIGLNKLTRINRTAIKQLIYGDYLYTLSAKHIEKILKELTKSERQTFLTKLDKDLSGHLHNSQKHEVYKVASQLKIRRFNKYRNDILDNDWTRV
jgi:hypothetical protein